jgi:hypothetical protein
MRWYGLDSSGLEWGLVADYEDSNALSGYIKCWEILE